MQQYYKQHRKSRRKEEEEIAIADLPFNIVTGTLVAGPILANGRVEKVMKNVKNHVIALHERDC